MRNSLRKEEQNKRKDNSMGLNNFSEEKIQIICPVYIVLLLGFRKISLQPVCHSTLNVYYK